jgi:hypothetical protein
VPATLSHGRANERKEFWLGLLIEKDPEAQLRAARTEIDRVSKRPGSRLDRVPTADPRRPHQSKTANMTPPIQQDDKRQQHHHQKTIAHHPIRVPLHIETLNVTAILVFRDRVRLLPHREDQQPDHEKNTRELQSACEQADLVRYESIDDSRQPCHEAPPSAAELHEPAGS